jgi:hypothetical protein
MSIPISGPHHDPEGLSTSAPHLEPHGPARCNPYRTLPSTHASQAAQAAQAAPAPPFDDCGVTTAEEGGWP